MGRFSFLLQRSADDADYDDRTADVSPDLAYELQSKMFDQIANVGIAGTGLAVTLIGSTLRDAPPVVWMSVVLFASAAFTAIGGNQTLVDSLSRRKPCLQRSRRDMRIATMLLGIAVGSLSMSVFLDGKREPVPVPTIATER